jgi:hypothetical protein
MYYVQMNGAGGLIDSTDFESLRKDMEHSDAQREVVIKRSRGATHIQEAPAEEFSRAFLSYNK